MTTSYGESYLEDSRFVARVVNLHGKGLNESERAKSLGMTVTELREKLGDIEENTRKFKTELARVLKEAGYSIGVIGALFGLTEDHIENMLEEEL